MSLMDKIKHRFTKMYEEIKELSDYCLCVELVPDTILKLEKYIAIKNGQ